MTCDEAIRNLQDLKMLKEIHHRMYQSGYNSLYTDNDLKKLISMTKEEIDNLLEIMGNMELTDSYDQNTGQINQIYKKGLV